MMNHYKVRKATLEDVPTLTRQRHSMFADMHPYSERKLAIHDEAFSRWGRREILARKLHCFIVEDAFGDIVGGGSVWLREVQPYPGFRGGLIPYLMSMYTNPAARRRGVATMIVNHIIDWSLSRGYESITLHASRKGRPLYSKLGWEESPEMELDLAKARRKTKSRHPRLRSRRSGR